MTPEAFGSWGWRIPFLLSIFLVGVGLYIRLRIEETPIFAEALARKEQVKVPLADLLRHQWRELLLAAGSMLMWSSFYYIGAVFFTSYGTTTLKLSQPTMLTINFLGALLYTLTVVIPSRLSDRIGRRKMILIGNAMAIPWALVVMPIINTGSVLLVGLAVIITMQIVGLSNGPAGAFLPEIFATKYRTTGAGAAYNLGSVLAGAIPPLLAASLLATYGSYAIGIMLAAYALLATGAVLLLRETRGTTLRSEREPSAAPNATASPVDSAETVV
ncbi:MAG: MFS transporter [Pseudonocardia sp.]|jgi:MFS family permease|uniref:MFS transporter n=1 Tax=Pseudonocardia sp. TaxID=60912 RepID=UPI001AD14210|nr:MFS transporter [Pseudonocardia sp.]MBN9099390.1 MFS transporter [Pseudonocardia sp.]